MLNNQEPSPSPRTSLNLLFALHLRNIHRVAAGRPNNKTNKNVLKRFNTRDRKGSGSGPMPVTTNDPGREVGLPWQQADGIIAHS